MNIFINLISKPWIIIIFNKEREVIDEISWDSSLKEFDTLLEKLTEIVEKNNLKFEDIKEIHTVNWPGWFTWTRTTALVINTIKYLYKEIKLFSYNFFEIAELWENNYPMLIKANKREYLVKSSKNSIPEIKRLEEISEDKYFWMWDLVDFGNKNTQINSLLDYKKIIKNLDKKGIEKIEPYYIKEPNITC